jgi:hypothetical protein
MMDIYIAMEESYKNGYQKGFSDAKKEVELLQRKGQWILKKGICFCPNCLTCGSPAWKVCPVCETKMEGVLEC